MANSIDMLREKRESGYGDNPTPKDGVGQDRTFKLTPEEIQGIGSSPDGSPVSCTVQGTLAQDGTFTVQSVSSSGGGPEMGTKPPMIPS